MIVLAEVLGTTIVAAVIAYAVLGGADYGGGILDLLSRGPRAEARREAIAHAMGPVWEANHVWLIFVIVLLFTAFPPAFAMLSVTFFWPFHLALVGIVLRGAAFVFRAYAPISARAQLAWSRVFGGASAVTPLLLGSTLGAVSTGSMQWISPFAIATGLLAVALCAWVAAVYLSWETRGELREDFRRSALAAWLVAGVISIATLILARVEAPRLWDGLVSARVGSVIAIGILLAPMSLTALWTRRFGAARVLAAAQVAILLLGWAIAQWPFIIFPTMTLEQAAAPEATLRAVASTLPFGLGVLLPSLWFLFRVFKSPLASEAAPRVPERQDV